MARASTGLLEREEPKICEPISLTLGAVAAATVYQTTQARKSAKEAAAIQQAAQTDPAAERAKAEAEAAQRANAQLADANRRRREQGSLLSKGAASAAPQFTLGDTTTQFAGQSPLSVDGGTTNRSTVAARTSLMSRGGVDVGGMPMRQGGQTYGGTKFGAGTL